jgi:hypothetical protein
MNPQHYIGDYSFNGLRVLDQFELPYLGNGTSDQALLIDKDGIVFASTTGIGSTGTVTNVSAQPLAPLFTVNVNTPDSTPDIIFSAIAQAASKVYIGPASGADANPTFRLLAQADIPGLDASKIISGILPIARGGTGLGTIGTATQMLRVTSDGTALEYFTLPTYLTDIPTLQQVITAGNLLTGNNTIEGGGHTLSFNNFSQYYINTSSGATTAQFIGSGDSAQITVVGAANNSNIFSTASSVLAGVYDPSNVALTKLELTNTTASITGPTIFASYAGSGLRLATIDSSGLLGTATLNYFIQNQLGTPQTPADFWISGVGRAAGGFRANLYASYGGQSQMRLGRAGDTYANFHLGPISTVDTFGDPITVVPARNINLSVIGNSAYVQALGEGNQNWDRFVLSAFNFNVGATDPHIDILIGSVEGGNHHRFVNNGNVVLGGITDDGINKLQVLGTVMSTSLITTGAAPATTGATMMLVSDETGLISFAPIPTGGGSVTPAALTRVSDTNVTLALTGTPTTALLQAVEITAGWTGILATGRGGTGIDTYALGDVIYSSATNTLGKLSGNTTTTRKFLNQTGNGTISAAPVWSALVAGDIPDISGSYIKNQTGTQSSANYNIDGTGTAATFIATADTPFQYAPTQTYGWEMIQRVALKVSNLPVASFRPVTADTAMAFDIMPNGSATMFGSEGIAWLDVCDTDIKTGNPAVAAARVGITDVAVQIGSKVFNGGTLKPLHLLLGTTAKMQFLTDSDGTVNLNTKRFYQSQSVNGDYVGHFLLNTDDTHANSDAIFFIGQDVATLSFGFLRWSNGATTPSGYRNPDQFEIIANNDATNGLVLGAIGATKAIKFVTGFSGNTEVARMVGQNTGFGVTSPEGIVHIKAGTATATTAPLVIDPGTNLSVLKDGACEYNGTHVYFTIGSTRYQLDQQVPPGGTTGQVLKKNSNTDYDYSWGADNTGGGGGGSLSDGDYGDITVSGSATVMTIDPRTVTFAKMQAIATNKLLGRGTASTGDIEEITLGNNLAFSSTTLNVTAAGSTTQVQYNNAGSLAGSASHTWDESAKRLEITGDIYSHNTQASVPTTGAQSLALFSNFTVPASISFAAGAVTAAGNMHMDYTFAGNSTIANSGVHGTTFNYLRLISSSTGATITVTQGSTTKRSIAAGIFQVHLPTGSTGTVTHVAQMELRGFYQDTGTTTAMTVTNAYGLLIGKLDENMQVANLTNKYALWQDGPADIVNFNGILQFPNLTNITSTNNRALVMNSSTGVVGYVTAGTDGHVLRRSGSDINFGTVATAGIADAAVTKAKIENFTEGSLLGRVSASSGAPEEVKGWIVVSSNTSGGSNVASLSITDFATWYSTYKHFKLKVYGLHSRTNTTVLKMRSSTDGSTFASAANSYGYRYDYGASINQGADNATEVQLIDFCSNAATAAVDLEITFDNPSQSTYHNKWRIVGMQKNTASESSQIDGVGTRVSAAVLRGFLFYFGTLNTDNLDYQGWTLWACKA